MEWRVMNVEELWEGYAILVVPLNKTKGIYDMSGAILFKLKRVRDSGMKDRYELSAIGGKRITYVPLQFLSLKNFKLELEIQTAMLC